MSIRTLWRDCQRVSEMFRKPQCAAGRCGPRLTWWPSKSDAPTEGVAGRQLLPAHGIRLLRDLRRFHQRPDHGLLIPEERLVALPVRPLVQDQDASAVVGAVEAVRDEAVA